MKVTMTIRERTDRFYNHHFERVLPWVILYRYDSSFHSSVRQEVSENDSLLIVMLILSAICLLKAEKHKHKLIS